MAVFEKIKSCEGGVYAMCTHGKLRSLLGILLIFFLLSSISLACAQGEEVDHSFLFCFDGDAKAGQQGDYPVVILEDMVQKDKTVFVDGAARIVVQGSNNPKTDGSNAKGTVPTTGAAMMVTAPADGTITVYGINGTNSSDGSGKTFWVVPEGGEAWSLSDPGEIQVSQDVKAGDKVWFYAAGSKFSYAAVKFVPKSAPIDQTAQTEGEKMYAAVSDHSFIFYFCEDGKELLEGEYGAVYLLEDMFPKDRTVQVNGQACMVLQGENNPKTDAANAKGSIPDNGAAVCVTAPTNGMIRVYGINGTNSSDGSGKTFWVVSEDERSFSLTDPGEIVVEYAAKTGERVWFYASGSKFQFGAVEFIDTDARSGNKIAQDMRPWEFTYFGPSTSETANRVEDGADINKSVTLYSCTVDENGNIVKKGGKFVADAPADGESFYYTTIDPSTENFKLMADVHVDYLNPAPDGQEGFALMLRDSISGTGSFYSNTISVASSKLRVRGKDTKTVLGTRNYIGIISNENADLNEVIETRIAYTEDETDLVKQGATYRLCLEKQAMAISQASI